MNIFWFLVTVLLVFLAYSYGRDSAGDEDSYWRGFQDGFHADTRWLHVPQLKKILTEVANKIALEEGDSN